MEKEYSISRLVLAVMAGIGSVIAFINEDISLKILGTAMFIATAILVSFIGSGISRKMIKIGDKIKRIYLRGGYYIALLLVILLVAYAVLILMQMNSDGIDNLGAAVLFFLSECCVFIFLIVPYIQTMIVLILRAIFS